MPMSAGTRVRERTPPAAMLSFWRRACCTSRSRVSGGSASRSTFMRRANRRASTRSRSSPPRSAMPAVAWTMKSVPSMRTNDASKVPPPKSNTTTVPDTRRAAARSPCTTRLAYSMAAADGSANVPITSKPASRKAARVTQRCAPLALAGQVMTASSGSPGAQSPELSNESRSPRAKPPSSSSVSTPSGRTIVPTRPPPTQSRSRRLSERMAPAPFGLASRRSASEPKKSRPPSCSYATRDGNTSRTTRPMVESLACGTTGYRPRSLATTTVFVVPKSMPRRAIRSPAAHGHRRLAEHAAPATAEARPHPLDDHPARDARRGTLLDHRVDQRIDHVERLGGEADRSRSLQQVVDQIQEPLAIRARASLPAQLGEIVDDRLESALEQLAQQPAKRIDRAVEPDGLRVGARSEET